MRTLKRPPTSSNRLRTAKPKSPKETLSEKLEQKCVARVEIWGALQVGLTRITDAKEEAKKLGGPAKLSEEALAIFDIFEQHAAAMREYFSADEDLDRESNPKIEPLIAKSLQRVASTPR